MFIQYSTDHAVTWHTIARQTKQSLDNMGSSTTAYTPTQMSDWAPMAVAIPAAAQTSYTVFRFRYKPNVGSVFGAGTSGLIMVPGTLSTGNNFYMDKINFNSIPASVNEVAMGKIDVALAPNPTNGNAYVVVKDADNTSVQIRVSDVTGKSVFTTTQTINGNEAQITIPHSYISVAGMYMVQVITGNQERTLKLVVY
jgi:hypothetical protein